MKKLVHSSKNRKHLLLIFRAQKIQIAKYNLNNHRQQEKIRKKPVTNDK